VNPQTQQLFIIIVHYGSPVPTLQAVTSIQAGTLQPTKIIIIDHAVHPLMVPGAAAQVLRPTPAGGYGAGVNLGLGALLTANAEAGDIVIAMNNDVVVQPTTIANLYEWWQAQTVIGLVGAVVEEAGKQVFGGGVVNYVTGRAMLAHQPTSALQYIHGAFIAATYDTWLTLHGMPEENFLYWEDTVLGRRARKKRLPIQLAPTVRVKHNTAATLTADHLYYLVRNGAQYVQYQLPWFIAVYWRLVNRLRWLWHRLLPGSRHWLVAEALRDAMAGRSGQRHPIIRP